MKIKPTPEFEPSEAVDRSSRLVIGLFGTLVLGLLVWASISHLDVISMANGEVAPSSEVKTVQHLEGGIVREIQAREGQRVQAGETLVVLEPTASGADVGELQVRLVGLRTDIARLDALIRDLEAPEFPPDLRRDYPLIVERALERFHTQRRRHESELHRQREEIAQRELEIREIETRIATSQGNLKLVTEQVAISEDLLREDLTNRFVHLDLLKEAAKIEGAIRTDRDALARARAAVAESRAGIAEIRATFEDENRAALDEARRTHAELSQRLQKFEDSLDRTVVRSPVDGVVKTLHVVTVGGVLRPGDAVAEIVPADDRLIVTAQLPTQDIGYVRVDQSATIKLASADAMRFGALQGRVVNVSPDTLEREDGMPYYEIRIETERDYFERGALRYNLFPGMQVVASIQTGRRTVLEYLLDPLRGNMSFAMQER